MLNTLKLNMENMAVKEIEQDKHYRNVKFETNKPDCAQSEEEYARSGLADHGCVADAESLDPFSHRCHIDDEDSCTEVGGAWDATLFKCSVDPIPQVVHECVYSQIGVPLGMRQRAISPRSASVGAKMVSSYSVSLAKRS